MPRKPSRILTDHELRLMEVLWHRQRATVADVAAAISGPPLAYSTVLTTLRTLEKKGYVAHQEAGRAFVYIPTIRRADAAQSAVGYLLERFFGSSPGALALSLLDDATLSDADLAEIRRAVSRRDRTKR